MLGSLRKLTALHKKPIEYQLPIGDNVIVLNPLLGKKISFEFQGKIYCVACNKSTNKSFGQGHCYRCFQTLAECDLCLMRPELCHYHKGTCREPAWGDAHCMKKHVVYLANTSGIKVGITRFVNVPSRWIDQGATQALPIFYVKTRYQSGLLEVALKNHIADKTNWRTMLKSDGAPIDLLSERDQLLKNAEKEVFSVQEKFSTDDIELVSDAGIETFFYPIKIFPQKPESLSFDKTPNIEGTLLGIKGQYLILDTGVLNIRKFSGYQVLLELC